MTESAVALGSITEREGVTEREGEGGWGGGKLICRPWRLFWACSKVQKNTVIYIKKLERIYLQKVAFYLQGRQFLRFILFSGIQRL